MSSTGVIPDLSAVLEPSGEPCLIGGRCPQCALVTFPVERDCPDCPGQAFEPYPLPRRGTLWSFTIQAFPLKEPYAGPSGEEFVPFGVGYVELPGGIVVEGRLTESDPDRLAIGMPVELVVEPFGGETGFDGVAFAFAPATDDRRPA